VSGVDGWERPAIVAVKSFHTAWFFAVAGSILYLLSGAASTSPRWVASHVPHVTIPLVSAAVVLHARDLWRQTHGERKR
jgi:hypothetical protein